MKLTIAAVILYASSLADNSASATSIQFKSKENTEQIGSSAIIAKHKDSLVVYHANEGEYDEFDFANAYLFHQDRRALLKKTGSMKQNKGAVRKPASKRSLGMTQTQSQSKGKGKPWLFNVVDPDDRAAFEVRNGIITKEENGNDSYCSDVACFAHHSGEIVAPDILDLVITTFDTNNAQWDFWCSDFSKVMRITVKACNHYGADNTEYTFDECLDNEFHGGPHARLGFFTQVSDVKTYEAELEIDCSMP